MKTVLTIAGSDCSGGAGIQADLKTMLANGVYGMSVITALTAQNTLGVHDILDIKSSFVEAQLETIFSDIPPDAIKIGMLSSKTFIPIIAKIFQKYKAKNIVLDPVMISTSGFTLLSQDAIASLKRILFPISTVITPNIPEAEVLSEIPIHSMEDMEKAVKKIGESYHCSVLCKGGHQIEDANDVLYHQRKTTWFYGKRIDNENTHGTGCTLSSAIASHLAKGESLETAVEKAKNYVTLCLETQLNLGKGNGPLDHGAPFKK